MYNAHDITKRFEEEICRYTNAKFCIAVDSCCSAIFLALTYYRINNNCKGLPVTIPSHTYPGVPAAIIHAGYKVQFAKSSSLLKGRYLIQGTNVWDCALQFTTNMYSTGMVQCLSFTGPHKILKLSKAGAILTDDEQAYKWLKKARFSGRAECSYHEDNFDDNPVIGWNMYLMPEIAARGLLLMAQFYNQDGTPKHNEDLCLPYPDLSKFKLWQ